MLASTKPVFMSGLHLWPKNKKIFDNFQLWYMLIATDHKKTSFSDCCRKAFAARFKARGGRSKAAFFCATDVKMDFTSVTICGKELYFQGYYQKTEVKDEKDWIRRHSADAHRSSASHVMQEKGGSPGPCSGNGPGSSDDNHDRSARAARSSARGSRGTGSLSAVSRSLRPTALIG